MKKIISKQGTNFCKEVKNTKIFMPYKPQQMSIFVTFLAEHDCAG